MRIRLFCFVGLLGVIAVAPSQAASLSYSTSLSATGTIGYSNSTIQLQPNLDTTTQDYGPLSGSAYFNLGTFKTQAANTNVVPTFTLDVNLTLTQGSTVVPETLDFNGSITSPSTGVYDLVFSSPSGTLAVNSSYPNPPGPLTFLDQTVSFGSLGTYTFGLESNEPLNVVGKTTKLFAFLSPSAPTVPEPVSSGLMGVSMLGLLGAAGIRRLRSRRS